VFYIPNEKLETAKTILGQMEDIFKNEFKNTDPELKLSLSLEEGKDTGDVRETMTPASTRKVIDFLLALPHGIWAVSTEGDQVHLVETSNNLASLKIVDKELKVITSQRSPISSRLDAVTQQIESVVRLAGGMTENNGRYPGWAANTASPILKKCLEVYEERFGKKPVVETTHGGLECGVIGTRYSGMDMISIGPTIRNPHSPEEKIHIGSIGKVWDFFASLLRELK
jgi:dipeptidase D